MPSQLDVRVPPRFCDSQGMVHASRYHEFLEDAFLQWLADQGLAYDEIRSSGLDLVIGTSSVWYQQPAGLGDQLRVTATATRTTTSTVTVHFSIARDATAVADADITYITIAGGRSAALPAPLKTAAERKAGRARRR
jgi:YbgC/YbaW family acyl-CoA thioester hydrolase